LSAGRLEVVRFRQPERELARARFLGALAAPRQIVVQAVLDVEVR
jgi:hypothetical protein